MFRPTHRILTPAWRKEPLLSILKAMLPNNLETSVENVFQMKLKFSRRLKTTPRGLKNNSCQANTKLKTPGESKVSVPALTGFKLISSNNSIFSSHRSFIHSNLNNNNINSKSSSSIFNSKSSSSSNKNMMKLLGHCKSLKLEPKILK